MTNTHSNIGFLFVQSNYFKKRFQLFDTSVSNNTLGV
uniref:Uncharacterized protein n=1 Tax=viral metagenome TaxID=1070528 RepID=A0A6C0B6R1_9ZZZZ